MAFPYPPVFLIDGSTSVVTHRLNFLASDNLLPKIRAYSPDSFTATISCFPPGVSHFTTPLSSSSTCAISASRVLEYPRAVATSFPMNQGSLFIKIVLISPNSFELKICNSFTLSPLSFLIQSYYLGFSLHKNIIHWDSGNITNFPEFAQIRLCFSAFPICNGGYRNTDSLSKLTLAKTCVYPASRYANSRNCIIQYLVPPFHEHSIILYYRIVNIKFNFFGFLLNNLGFYDMMNILKLKKGWLLWIRKIHPMITYKERYLQKI